MIVCIPQKNLGGLRLVDGFFNIEISLGSPSCDQISFFAMWMNDTLVFRKGKSLFEDASGSMHLSIGEVSLCNVEYILEATTFAWEVKGNVKVDTHEPSLGWEFFELSRGGSSALLERHTSSKSTNILPLGLRYVPNVCR